jgi:hypothetical protein
MPAAVLVVLVLGAIAVDMTIVHLGEREAITAAQAAADDAVTWGVDDTALYGSGTYRLDHGRVAEAVRTSLAHHELSGRLTDLHVTVDGPTVSVTVELEVGYVFTPIIPHAPHHTRVQATASASALER